MNQISPEASLAGMQEQLSMNLQKLEAIEPPDIGYIQEQITKIKQNIRSLLETDNVDQTMFLGVIELVDQLNNDEADDPSGKTKEFIEAAKSLLEQIGSTL